MQELIDDTEWWNGDTSIWLPYRVSSHSWSSLTGSGSRSVRAAWFLALTAITCARECSYMCISQVPRCDVSAQRFHRKAHIQGSLAPGSVYGNGNDPVVLTNETAARNEATLHALTSEFRLLDWPSAHNDVSLRGNTTSENTLRKYSLISFISCEITRTR